MRSAAVIQEGTPKDQGEAVATHLLGAVEGLGWVPDETATWHDFVVSEPVTAESVPLVGVDRVDQGTRGEVKAAQRWISDGANGRRRGRYYIKRASHAQLLAVDGVYLLAVYVAGDPEPIKHAALVPATRVEEVLGTWSSVTASWGTADVAKLTWSAVFDADQLPESTGGGTMTPAADPVVLPDGGVIEYECPDCGVVTDCDVDREGTRRCRDCGKAVLPVVTDGGTETVWTKSGTHGVSVLHLERDCPRLSPAKNVHDHARSAYPDDTPVCEVCKNGLDAPDGAGSVGPWIELADTDPDDLLTDGGECLECGETWEENPARKVKCPTCGAAVGSPCKRPSGWTCSPHAARYQAAVSAVCPLDDCLAVDDKPEQATLTDGGVVPEDIDAEELHRRVNAPSSTPEEKIERCPECENASVTPIVGVHGAEHDYRCNNAACLARVDEDDLVVWGDDS